MKIRSHLLLLALGVTLPVLAFAFWVSALLVEQDRQTVRNGTLNSARAMVTAVDAELRGSLTSLGALASSRALESDELATFHGEAVRVLASQPAWVNVTLVLPSGEQILSARDVYGTVLPKVTEITSLERAVRTLQPAIGGVDVSAGASVTAAIPVRIPVIHKGAAKYLLTARVRPDSFDQIIRQQDLPDNWIAAIIDESGRFVARVPARTAGDLASLSLRQAVRQVPEGWYRGLTVDGKDVFTAHARSGFSNWAVGLALPTEEVEKAATRTSRLLALGAVVSLLAAAAFAFFSGRRVVSPIQSLAAAARSLGTGGSAVSIQTKAVSELAQLALALQEAGATVHERQRLMEREKESLEAADRTKDEFIAMLSHELRNPLAGLSAASQILNMGNAQPSAITFASQVVDRQTRQMSRLIEDLLDLSRITTGKVTLHLEKFNLADAVSAVVDTWRGADRLKGHHVSRDLVPAWIVADRVRVEQIFSNLLDNALKFTEAGKQIAVTIRVEAGQAVLRVSDQGEGIHPHNIHAIFDLFTQGAAGIDRGKSGMGIGLAIVKRLTALQGGTISAASDGPGLGSTFEVRLPIAIEQE